jgi:hypothetical protein
LNTSSATLDYEERGQRNDSNYQCHYHGHISKSRLRPPDQSMIQRRQSERHAERSPPIHPRGVGRFTFHGYLNHQYNERHCGERQIDEKDVPPQTRARENTPEDRPNRRR